MLNGQVMSLVPVARIHLPERAADRPQRRLGQRDAAGQCHRDDRRRARRHRGMGRVRGQVGGFVPHLRAFAEPWVCVA
jgi:hypothetical protein